VRPRRAGGARDEKITLMSGDAIVPLKRDALRENGGDYCCLLRYAKLHVLRPGWQGHGELVCLLLPSPPSFKAWRRCARCAMVRHRLSVVAGYTARQRVHVAARRCRAPVYEIEYPRARLARAPRLYEVSAGAAAMRAMPLPRGGEPVRARRRARYSREV